MTRTELEQCIDLYGKDIFSFCRYATGSLQEGEELYQDTFLKAVELLDRMDISQNPKSFLLSIAIRLWKNRRRKYAWRRRIAGMESLEEKDEYQNIPSSSENSMPEEVFLHREWNAPFPPGRDFSDNYSEFRWYSAWGAWFPSLREQRPY